MQANYVNRLSGVSGTAGDHQTLPEAELWTQVILQAITDLDGRTSLTPRWAKYSAREWFASESDAVRSFIWTCQIINVDPYFIRLQITKKLRMKNPVQIMPSRAERAKALRRKNSPLSDNLGRAQGRPAFKRLAV
jgi:hypothetical protein